MQWVEHGLGAVGDIHRGLFLYERSLSGCHCSLAAGHPHIVDAAAVAAAVGVAGSASLVMLHGAGGALEAWVGLCDVWALLCMRLHVGVVDGYGPLIARASHVR